MTTKVSLKVKCPHCNASLMDYNKPLNGEPSIKSKIINHAGDAGMIWLCSTYGCYDKVSSVDLKEGTRVKLVCPHCEKELNTEIKCQQCDANMVKFNIEIGGIVSICDRVGCKSHYVMIEDITDTLRKFHDVYGI